MMVTKHFEVGDLVWAKMKGYSHWPGEISISTKSEKIKKSHHYVYFYGSDNYAWIPDENIELHNETLVAKYAKHQKRSQVYLKAVEKIVLASKGISKYLKDFQISYENHSSYSKSLSSISGKRKSSFTKYSKKHSLESSPPKRKKNHCSRVFSFDPSNISFGHEGLGYSDDTNVDSVPGMLSRNVYKERPKTPPVDLNCENYLEKFKEIVPTTKKIGFLGLGRIGQRLIRNLLLSGHSVTLWNRSTEKYDKFVLPSGGAKIAQTPADVITECDITFCCVSGPDVSRTLVFGNCGVLKCSLEKKGFVEMTSLDPHTSCTIGLEINRKGGRYLEAQMNGSRQDASDSKLHILAAGDESLYNDCYSCFSALADSHVFIGPQVGIASKYSIIHDMLNGAVYVALAECLALVERVGLDQEDFLKILEFGELNSPVVLEKAHSMIQNDYKSETPLKHVQQNINLAMKLGSEVQLWMPITAEANEIYKHCKLLRYMDHDVSAVYEGTTR